MQRTVGIGNSGSNGTCGRGDTGGAIGCDDNRRNDTVKSLPIVSVRATGCMRTIVSVTQQAVRFDRNGNGDN